MTFTVWLDETWTARDVSRFSGSSDNSDTWMLTTVRVLSCSPRWNDAYMDHCLDAEGKVGTQMTHMTTKSNSLHNKYWPLTWHDHKIRHQQTEKFTSRFGSCDLQSLVWCAEGSLGLSRDTGDSRLSWPPPPSPCPLTPGAIIQTCSFPCTNYPCNLIMWCQLKHWLSCQFLIKCFTSQSNLKSEKRDRFGVAPVFFCVCVQNKLTLDHTY